MGINRLGRSNFLNLSLKAQKNFSAPLAPKLVVPYCHELVWVGGRARHESAPGGAGCTLPEQNHDYHAWECSAPLMSGT